MTNKKKNIRLLRDYKYCIITIRGDGGNGGYNINNNVDIIERVGKALLNNDKGRAKDIIEAEYKLFRRRNGFIVMKKL